jgi:anti-anti-sigma factor
MKNFSLSYQFGYLVATLKLKKATILEAIDFKSILDEEIHKGQYNIIIDLNDCEYIDSTFIGVLVVTWKKLRSNGGTLKLVKLGSFAHSVFYLSGAVELFEHYQSVEEAISSFITPIEDYYSSNKPKDTRI